MSKQHTTIETDEGAVPVQCFTKTVQSWTSLMKTLEELGEESESLENIAQIFIEPKTNMINIHIDIKLVGENKK